MTKSESSATRSTALNRERMPLPWLTMVVGVTWQLPWLTNEYGKGVAKAGRVGKDWYVPASTLPGGPECASPGYSPSVWRW